MSPLLKSAPLLVVKEGPYGPWIRKHIYWRILCKYMVKDIMFVLKNITVYFSHFPLCWTRAKGDFSLGQVDYNNIKTTLKHWCWWKMWKKKWKIMLVWKIEAKNWEEALDKCNIYHFISNSIENFKLNQYWNFQLILSLCYPFMSYFVNSIIFRVSHWLLYCIFIKVNLKDIKYKNSLYFSIFPSITCLQHLQS